MKRGAAACLAFIESYHKRQRASLESAAKENADTARRCSISKSENEALRQYIIEKRFQDQDAQIRQLRGENDVLKAKVASHQAAAAELEQARREKAALQEEIAKMSASAKERERSLSERIGVLCEELGKYKTASEAEIQLNELLKERIQELEEVVKKCPPQGVSIASASLSRGSPEAGSPSPKSPSG